MSTYDPDAIQELQEDIERRSGDRRSMSAEEATQAAIAEHQARQLASGYTPKPTPIGNHVKPPTNPRSLEILRKCEEAGEPAFVFRARDFFSIMVLSYYADVIERYGPDDADFHRDVVIALGDFKDWQKANINQVRYPD